MDGTIRKWRSSAVRPTYRAVRINAHPAKRKARHGGCVRMARTYVKGSVIAARWNLRRNKMKEQVKEPLQYRYDYEMSRAVGRAESFDYTGLCHWIDRATETALEIDGIEDK